MGRTVSAKQDIVRVHANWETRISSNYENTVLQRQNGR